MTGLAAAVLAVQCAAAPEAATQAPKPSADTTSLEASRDESLWFIEHDARRERRRRITTGALQVTTGAAQGGMGLYVLLGVPTDVGSVDISGILNTAAGGGLILQGILGLARRGPLEKLVRDPEFERAKGSEDGSAWIERRLEQAARRGRIERRVAGSLSLVSGVAIIGLGINNLVDDNLRDKPAQVVLGAVEVSAGLGFSSFGIQMLALPSQAEHTLEAWRHRASPSKTSRVRSISVSPTLGGVQVSGRF